MVVQGTLNEGDCKSFSVVPRANETIVGLLIAGDVEVSISSGIRKAMVQIPIVHSFGVAPDLRIHRVAGLQLLNGIIRANSKTHGSIYAITETTCK